LDFPFNKEEDMSNFTNWLTAHNYSLKSILCTCSDEKIWAKRFNVRKLNPLPNQLITDFDELKDYYNDLSIEPFKDELIIDTIEPLDAIIQKALAYLNYT
jgi:hypothetical protein